MAIKREDLKTMDFSDVAAGRRLRPIHPGEILMKEFIEPLGLTHYRVAKGLNIQQRRIDEICNGDRAITADTALRLGQYFGTGPELWINLQGHYELKMAERKLRKIIEKEVSPLAA